MNHKTIKIAHITQTLNGGMHTYFRNVLPTLTENGLSVTLICPAQKKRSKNNKLLRKLKKTGVRIINIPMTKQINPIADLYAFVAILCVFLKHKFDIIHSHCSKAGALARTAAMLAGIKNTIHSSHCFAALRTTNRVKKYAYHLIEKILAKATNCFVAVSKADLNFATKSNLFPCDKCTVIQNALPQKARKENFLPFTAKITKTSLGVRPGNKVVTSATRLVEYKGIWNLLNAVKTCKEEKITFLIAGDGKLKRKVRKFILENNLSQNVNLLGEIPNLDKIYSITDVFVLCSEAEAQPYAVLEAMRAGCPVIATDVPGNHELLSNNRGLLVKPQPGEIANAILELTSNRQKQKLFSQNAYLYFKKFHSLQKQIKKLTSLYNSLVQKD